MKTTVGLTGICSAELCEVTPSCALCPVRGVWYGNLQLAAADRTNGMSLGGAGLEELLCMTASAPISRTTAKAAHLFQPQSSSDSILAAMI